MLLSSTVITKYIIFQLFFFSVHYSGATLEKHWSTLTRWWKLVSNKLRFVFFCFPSKNTLNTFILMFWEQLSFVQEWRYRLHTNQVAQQATTCMYLSCIWHEVIRSSPSAASKFAGTHSYTWVERGTVRVKCLSQEHQTVSPAMV